MRINVLIGLYNKMTIKQIIQAADIPVFTKRVYEIVADIPKGHTLSYRQVAIAAGNPNAVRAVGNILNKNPFAPRVPCHRVIRSDGSLGGFAYGAKKKRALLRAEGVI